MLRELKNETTLAAIAENPEKTNHALFFGVIIDISEPYKNEKSDNYTTNIKIIDPSFNYKSQIANPLLKFHKFVRVNIFTETPDNAPKVEYVGEIIRLRRFKFKLTERGQLIGNMQKFSNWLIYPGKEFKERKVVNPDLSFCYKLYPKNKDRVLNTHEKGRLEDLREWADSFFFQNSMRYINWWNNRKKTGKEEDVDLILKCVKFSSKKKQMDFIDEDKHKYKLNLQYPKNVTNKILKLRCVNITPNSNKDKTPELSFTKMSSCLIIPPYFYDYRKFLTPGKKTPGKDKTTLLDNFKWLKDFNMEDVVISKGKSTPRKKGSRLVSVVRNIHSKKTVSLSALKKILEKPMMHKNEKFMFQGKILGISENDPKTFLKKMVIQTKKIHNYDKVLKTGGNKKNKFRVFYHMVLMVTEESEKTNKTLDVYITTTDGDHHLFETWDILPQSDKMKDWANVKDKNLKDFSNKLMELKNPSNKVKFCLQLMITKKGQAFFKLVDTIFLPL